MFISEVIDKASKRQAKFLTDTPYLGNDLVVKGKNCYDITAENCG
jgi:hypothetical protein